VAATNVCSQADDDEDASVVIRAICGYKDQLEYRSCLSWK